MRRNVFSQCLMKISKYRSSIIRWLGCSAPALKCVSPSGRQADERPFLTQAARRRTAGGGGQTRGGGAERGAHQLCNRYASLKDCSPVQPAPLHFILNKAVDLSWQHVFQICLTDFFSHILKKCFFGYFATKWPPSRRSTGGFLNSDGSCKMLKAFCMFAGILQECLQQYGSLIPVHIDDVVEKLQDLFKENFSQPHRSDTPL